jgi:hypothetical protein
MSPTGHSCRPRRASRSETRKHQDLTRRHGQNPRFRSCQGGPARVRRNRPRRFSYAKPQKTPSCCLVRCPFAINSKFSGFLQSIAILPPTKNTVSTKHNWSPHIPDCSPTLSPKREHSRPKKGARTLICTCARFTILTKRILDVKSPFYGQLWGSLTIR